MEKELSLLDFLNLRGLDLSASDVIAIVSSLNQRKNLFKTISFSYNILLGDLGAIALSKKLSSRSCEIGLVKCGRNDVGGIEILNLDEKFSSTSNDMYRAK